MDEGVSTSMDQLVEMLDKTGAVKLTDAARDLGVDKDHIEGWAKMLEKEDVAKIHYSIVGGAIIRKGPNFDSFIKRLPGKKPARQTKPQEAETETKKRSEKKEEAKPTNDYALIRKQIDDEQATIEQDLKSLHEEQAKIVQYMNSLIEEGNKLVEYVGALRQIIEATKAERDKALDDYDNSKK